MYRVSRCYLKMDVVLLPRLRRGRSTTKERVFMENLIDVKNVYKIYNRGDDDIYALDGVSLKIKKGEFVAVMGSSGSGKSTLMNMLGCLDTPTSGDYFLENNNVRYLKDSQLSTIRNRKIGFIFQSFNLIQNLNALENIELPLIYRGVPKNERKKLAKEALSRVGLTERSRHRPSQMSGGQQQRTAVARAIAAKPSIILADEPTGNLDTKASSDVINILSQLHKEGRTIILITHDINVAKAAQRKIIINNGKID